MNSMSNHKIALVGIIVALLTLAGAWMYIAHESGTGVIVPAVGAESHAAAPVKSDSARSSEAGASADAPLLPPAAADRDEAASTPEEDETVAAAEVPQGEASPVLVGTPERPSVRITVLGSPQADMKGGRINFLAAVNAGTGDAGRMWVVEYDETGKCAFRVWPGNTYRFSVFDKSGAVGDALLAITGTEHEQTIVLFHSYNCELLVRDQFDRPAVGVVLDLHLYVEVDRRGHMSKLITDGTGVVRVSVPPHFTHAKPHIEYDTWKTFHRDSIRRVHDLAHSHFPLPISRQMVVLHRLLPEETPGMLKFVFPEADSKDVHLVAGHWKETLGGSGIVSREFARTAEWSLGPRAGERTVPVYPGAVEGRLTSSIDGVAQIMYFSLQVRGAGAEHPVNVVWRPATEVKIVLKYDGAHDVSDTYYMIDDWAWEGRRTQGNSDTQKLPLGTRTLTLLSEKFQVIGSADWKFDVKADTTEVTVPIEDRTGPVVRLAGLEDSGDFYAESLDGHYGRVYVSPETKHSETREMIVYPGRWRIVGHVERRWHYCDFVVYPNQGVITLTAKDFRPRD